jgi:hypothetical protein
MGGCGSGRKKTRERELVENCDSLDISVISQYGWSFYPIFGKTEKVDDKEFLLINYNKYWFGKRLDLIEHIEIEKTYPYFGGSRYWMRCPGCEERVQKIYSPPTKTLFRCRKCYDLMYQSQESNVWDGIRRKLAKANGMTPMQYDRMVFG